MGGFGEIYLCHEDTSRKVTDEAPLAMKIEPHENGPLFVEMNFYIRACKPDDGELEENFFYSAPLFIKIESFSLIL